MGKARRIVITGAAGNLGAKLARHLEGRFDLVLMDRPEGDLSTWNEDWVARFAGCEVVFHLAGNHVAHHGWDELTGPNVDAVLNVFEASARQGVRRVVFASSNHVMGGYRDQPETPIGVDLPPRPGLRYTTGDEDRSSAHYAATKLFGERVGRHFAETRGLEVICVRIGWVWRGDNSPAGLPADRGEWFRSMWLSDPDYLRLMECCLVDPLPRRFLIVNGMSANTGMRWDLTETTGALGYHPRDDVYRTTPEANR